MDNHYNCIYMYINKINGKRYVGQARDFNRRHKQHRNASKNKFLIDKAFNKYGEENFEIKILAENIPTQEKMNEYEIFFIKRYNTFAINGNGYNIADGGNNGNPYAGKTEEEMNDIKNKISYTRIKNGLAKGENNPMYGKHHSEEAKRKVSEANRGENNPCFGRTGENHPMYGKHLSEKTKQKISESQSIKIAQYNKKTNELIKIWDGANKIQRELGVDNSSIITCCKWYACGENLKEWYRIRKRRPIKSAGGFIWKYYEEDNKNE